jgi:NAD-dependent oxidoreductase involved in siderophore biosynthesis
MIAFPKPSSEKSTGIQVGPIRLVCQTYIDAGDPDAHMHVGEVVREALANVAAGRGPATGLVVQVYSAELFEQGV